MSGFVYVFQNYIWVPIISAIIGTLLGWGGPIIIKYLKRKRDKRINESVDEISIEGDWNSFFGEEKNLQTEEVHLNQLGREVTGSMKLGNRIYEFKGEFKNQILLGTYESKNRRKDERGTINCCCNCEEIDMPILLPFEAENISRITKRSIDSFAIKLTNNLYQMRRANDDEKRECVFFQNSQCSIYANRPTDCRMFPFDFKEIDGEYWVIYYNKVCQAIPSNKDEIEMCAHNMRPLLNIVLPYISECSDPIFSKRLLGQECIKLFPINKIIDDQGI